MKIRIIGSKQEITKAIKTLAAEYTLNECGGYYPCKGDDSKFRCYIEAVSRNRPRYNPYPLKPGKKGGLAL